MSCIHVNGPAFAGKTTFILKLIEDIPELSVVNYELFYSKKKSYAECSQNFYNYIYGRINNNEKVICESIPNNILIKELCNVTFPIPMLFIVVLPTIENHIEYQQAYLKEFGYKQIKARNGGISIADLRSAFLAQYKMDGIIYDGTNYNEILEIIKKYVEHN